MYYRLKDLKEDYDKTPADIAKILNITQQQYSVYENGKQEFPTRHLKTLCFFMEYRQIIFLAYPIIWNIPSVNIFQQHFSIYIHLAKKAKSISERRWIFCIVIIIPLFRFLL